MAVEAKTIFEAISKPPIELLAERGMGLYIPSYQRPYSWDKEKVNRLLEDLGHGIKTLLRSDDSFTFLGTVITIHDTNNSTVQPIVRSDVPSKVLTVIDGQQRMTTLLILNLALHNQIQVTHKKFTRKKTTVENNLCTRDHSSLDFGEDINTETDNILQALEWLDGQTKEVLSLLEDTFFEKHRSGQSPLYPRMIRSLDDQWSKSARERKYQSPIANLIFNYITQIDDPLYQATDYKPSKREKNIEGEEAIVDRFNQIIKALASLSSNRNNVMEEVPTIEEIYKNENFQVSLLNYPMPIEHIRLLRDSDKEIFDELLLLVLYALYVLHRVVLTVVKGKNEDYAFTIFESLNTTGEPLTAFETFKPRVVNAVGLAEYDGSPQKAMMDEVGNYLSKFPVGAKLQTATKDLLIQFFATYTGDKVSGRLAEQRAALKNAFEETENTDDFIKTLSITSNFKSQVWEADNLNTSIAVFSGHELSSLSKLALKFFNDINHTIVIPILTIFFKQIQEASSEDKLARFKDFESALQAMFAFSVLWRASRAGTAGIDGEYRELLNKNDMPSGLAPISIKHTRNQVVDIDLFKKELKSRLQDDSRKGKLKDKETFVQNSYARPIYKSPKIAKALLLSAHHNAIENQETNDGSIVKGKEAVNACLTLDKYMDESSFSLEHIAPQSNNGKWETAIYTTPDIIDSLGNLTLVSHSLNSSMSNRMWAEKRVFYRVVGAKTYQEASQILAEATQANRASLKEHTQDILAAQKYMPNLVAIGNYEGAWTKEFIEKRSKDLYALAWDELIQFLESK